MSEPRQRWRLIVARGPAARDLVHRDVTTAWESGLRSSGLPIAETEGATPRLRIVYAAPAPVGMLAERELIDVFLAERLRIAEVRAGMTAAAPPGYRLVDLYDIWIGAPTLPSLVVAADYRADLEQAGSAGPETDRAALETAIASLLAVARVERLRAKGSGEVAVDIRPHIVELRLLDADAGRVDTGPALAMRLRLGGEGGVGRPEEVVAALGERLGHRLDARRIVRERIVLADDPPG